MILSKKKAISSFWLIKPLVHSTMAMSTERSYNTIVSLGNSMPPETRKLGPAMSNSVLTPFNVTNQIVENGEPNKLTLQIMETFTAFSNAGNTTVPLFSTNGSVDSPLTWTPSSEKIAKQTQTR